MLNKISLFAVVFISFTVVFACKSENNPTENNNNNVNNPPQIITLNTRTDCKVILDNVTTIVTDLIPGELYTVSVSSSEISGTPMKGAFFMYQTSDQGVKYRYVDDGESFTFRPVNATRKIAPFLVDWSTAADNYGTVIIIISGPTTKVVTLNARTDCKVILDNVTTIVTDLIPGELYTVSVSSSEISGTPMKGAFFMYQTSDQGVKYRYVDDGESFTFRPVNATRKIAPFLVDWSTAADNSGSVTITID